MSTSVFTRRLILAFAFCSALSVAYTFSRPAQLRLTLEMSSTRASTAQLFFDIGSGFTEADSVTVPVTSGAFQQLSFDLPHRTLFHLRFDPLMNDGRVTIRNVAIVNSGTLVLKIPATGITSLNQIASRSVHGDSVDLNIVPGGTDPSLLFTLAQPLKVRWLFKGQDLRFLALVNGLLFALAIGLYLGRRAVAAAFATAGLAIKRVDQRFDRLAGRLSSGDFLQLDSLAIWVYASLLALFAVGSVLDLNGSSEGLYSASYHHGVHVHAWFGSPKAIRADEWAYETPDILNQYFRENRFAVADSVLGNHSVVLTGNVPARHVSMLFRPQLWSFFVLPLDYGYAVYWQFKALILVGGIFTFLLWITRSSFWSVVGALWYFFSAFTQWTYSWPSALPEMVGMLCLATVFWCYVTVGRSPVALALSAVGAALCTINFALCAYLPHLIPLFWAGAAAGIAWCIAERERIFATSAARPRLIAAVLAAAVVAACGALVYEQLKPAIAAVAQTVYPGQRVVPGGSMSPWTLSSHFLQWTETDNQFPPALGNISEGSGFLWLVPVSLLCLYRCKFSRFQRAALIALWACFLLILCWLVFPLPVAFGRIFGLDRTMGARCLPALGLANIAIVVLTAAHFRRKPLPADDSAAKRNTAYFLGVLAVCYPILRATNTRIGNYFTLPEIALPAVFLAILIVLLVTGKRRAFAFFLLVPQALAFGFVNPVEQGLPVFTHSELFRFVQTHRNLLTGKWLIYSSTPISSGFFAAAGCQVYTGTHYLPDIDHFRLFASRGMDVNAINRLGYLDAHAVPSGTPPRFVQEVPIIVRWDVAPTDPLLPEVGIRYVAFDFEPSAELTQGLTPLATHAVDGFWLYRIGHSSEPAQP